MTENELEAINDTFDQLNQARHDLARCEKIKADPPALKTMIDRYSSQSQIPQELDGPIMELLQEHLEKKVDELGQKFAGL